MNDESFISEDIQTLINKTPSWTIRWGSTITVIVLCLLFNLTWLVKYPDVIEGEVIITTYVPPEKHYAAIFGKIDTLLVSNHDIVKKGDIIAILQNNANHNDIFEISRLLETFNFNNDSFFSKMDSISNLNLGDLEFVYSEFENSYLDFKIHTVYSPEQNKANARESSILDIENRLTVLNKQKLQQQKEVDFFKTNLNRYSELYRKQVVSLSEYESKQIEYLNSEKKLTEIVSEILSVKETKNTAKFNQTDSDYILKRQQLYLRNSLIQNYKKFEGAIRNWKQKYLIQSTIDGRVNFNQFWSSKKTLNKGDLVCTILPKDTDYILKVKTVQKGLGKIKKDCLVNIDLDNYPAYENGYLLGTITNVPLFPEEDGSYILDAVLNNGLSTSYKKEILFTQEMKGQAEIITDKTSLAEKLLFSLKSMKKY